MQVKRKAATDRSIEITVKIEAPKPTSEDDNLDLEVWRYRSWRSN
jgi:hypothetical protein